MEYCTGGIFTVVRDSYIYYGFALGVFLWVFLFFTARSVQRFDVLF